MTDNKIIDPEQARLAIELADVCVELGGGITVYGGNRDAIAKKARTYHIYMQSKRIRDAEQEVIGEALNIYEYGLQNLNVPGPKDLLPLYTAVEKYQALVKDKAS